MELPFDPVIPFLGIYPKNPESPIRKKICTPIFLAVFFPTAKCWKQPKCPSVDEWIKKPWYMCMLEYYAAVKKSEIFAFAGAWMSSEGIESGINQTKKDE